MRVHFEEQEPASGVKHLEWIDIDGDGIVLDTSDDDFDRVWIGGKVENLAVGAAPTVNLFPLGEGRWLRTFVFGSAVTEITRQSPTL